MNTLDRFKAIDEWYNNSKVKFNIRKLLYSKQENTGREFAMLIPSWCNAELRKTSTRMLNIHTVQDFDYLRKKRLKMIERKLPYNMYYSLATYTGGIPKQTANFHARDNTEFENNHYSYMQGYDFLIDIDAGDFTEIDLAKYSTDRIIDLFNANSVPYEVRFSGKGFHIIVPYSYFKSANINVFNPKTDNSIYHFYAKTAKWLSSKVSEMIDTNIYDSRRVCKIPFSLALYEEQIYVCYPFASKEEIDNFSLADYELSNFSLAKLDQNSKVFNVEGNITFLQELIK